MKIKCRCSRILVVPKELAGKKIACKHCGQRYRLPPAEGARSAKTLKVAAWGDGDEHEHTPADVGACWDSRWRWCWGWCSASAAPGA